uniref:SLC35A4 upstream open reading frame protein-like n=1 Tax=Takifugu rubripes TaxID=31033 RepID=A0A674N9J8_TAKRU
GKSDYLFSLCNFLVSYNPIYKVLIILFFIFPLYPFFQNTLGQLKDLVELKDQLEDIQKRVEDEIQAGLPPGGSLLASPFLKGFLAGYVVARLRSSALMGVAIGTCTGMYAAQNYAVPNIENTIKDYIRNLKGGNK